MENETFIQESLSRLVKDKTVILIAVAVIGIWDGVKQGYGFNKNSQIIKIILFPFISALIAWLCTIAF